MVVDGSIAPGKEEAIIVMDEIIHQLISPQVIQQQQTSEKSLVMKITSQVFKTTQAYVAHSVTVWHCRRASGQNKCRQDQPTPSMIQEASLHSRKNDKIDRPLFLLCFF